MQEAGLKKIKETGEGFCCLCPLHDNTRSPALYIASDTGLWLCMNPVCDSRGNLRSFLTKVCKLSYTEIEAYVNATPVSEFEVDQWSLPEWGSEEVKQEGLNEAILGLYRKCPVYMLERGFDGPFLKAYEIGFDTDANRVTFVVRDAEGKFVGCTRRAIDDAWPKYLHDFEKKGVLYLLNRVKHGDSVCLTEGPVDALRLRQLEIQPNAVCTFGAQVTEQQIDVILEREPSKVVLAFDNDDPGKLATLRTLKMLGKRGYGNVEILVFPGHDPGELALDSEALDEIRLVPSYLWLHTVAD